MLVLMRQLVMTLLILSGLECQANTRAITEEKFQDLFVTAGYSTAFGAALGAATLALTETPEKNLHYVAVGASLGFISGSFFGGYFIFLPEFSFGNQAPSVGREKSFDPTLSYNDKLGVKIKPNFNMSQFRLASIEADWVFMKF